MGGKTPKAPLTWQEIAAGAVFVGSMLGGVGLFASWANYVEKRGKMLQYEWKLKYDEKGKPRPEFWQRQLLAEQWLEKEREEATRPSASHKDRVQSSSEHKSRT